MKNNLLLGNVNRDNLKTPGAGCRESFKALVIIFLFSFALQLHAAEFDLDPLKPEPQSNTSWGYGNESVVGPENDNIGQESRGVSEPRQPRSGAGGPNVPGGIGGTGQPNGPGRTGGGSASVETPGMSFGDQGARASSSGSRSFLDSDTSSDLSTEASTDLSDYSAFHGGDITDTTQKNEKTIPNTARTIADPNNPFYALQLESEPTDANSSITGVPLTLYEIVAQIRSPQARAQTLELYWELAGEIAKYKILLYKLNQVSYWVNLPDAAQRAPNFRMAEKLAQAECKSAELAVKAKQIKLAAMLKRYGVYRPVLQASGGNAQAEKLPIPCDLPLVSSYETRYDKIVQVRQVTENASVLDKLIPLQKEILDAKIDEYNSANVFLEGILKSDASDAGVIGIHNQSIAAYCALVDAIVEYNKMIAEYVSQTVGPEIQGRRLLEMHVKLNPE
ncbi:MAG: hypothetical protein ACRC2T_18580 [Thermoguttaceae bacterium]